MRPRGSAAFSQSMASTNACGMAARTSNLAGVWRTRDHRQTHSASHGGGAFGARPGLRHCRSGHGAVFRATHVRDIRARSSCLSARAPGNFWTVPGRHQRHQQAASPERPAGDVGAGGVHGERTSRALRGRGRPLRVAAWLRIWLGQVPVCCRTCALVQLASAGAACAQGTCSVADRSEWGCRMRAAPAWIAVRKQPAGGSAPQQGAWASTARVYLVHRVRFLPGDVQDVRLLGI
jgi:hypothetical protein